MKATKRKIVESYTDYGCGFPVKLRNVTMFWYQDDWVADINYNQLADNVSRNLASKTARLTGAEVKFLRLHLQMTFQKFADLFGVQPQAVMKWEKTGQQPTKMTWTTEKDLRLTVLERLGTSKDQFFEAYQLLREEKPARLKYQAQTIDLRGSRPRRRQTTPPRTAMRTAN